MNIYKAKNISLENINSFQKYTIKNMEELSSSFFVSECKPIGLHSLCYYNAIFDDLRT